MIGRLPSLSLLSVATEGLPASVAAAAPRPRARGVHLVVTSQEVIDITQYDWETVYDVEGYIDLLNTFSGHIAMQDWQRACLCGEIRRRLARRPDGLVRRHWGGVLHIARRRTAKRLQPDIRR